MENSMMNLTMILLMLLFCGLTVGETETTATQTVCEPTVRDLLKELGAMREKVEALESRVKDNDKQIEELRSKEKRVVFSAAVDGNANIGPFATDTTVIYSTVITNTGAAYNKFTGIFTAPVTGLYYFIFFYHAGAANPVTLHLVKNDQNVVMTHDHKTVHDGADNGGNAVFLQLQLGDEVFVRLGANTHIWPRERITTFSGFMIDQD